MTSKRGQRDSCLNLGVIAALAQGGAEHPGTMLRAALDSIGMSQRELADIIARPPQTLSEMIHGKNAISSQTALQLASVFGIPAEVWVVAQALHDLHLARSGRSQSGHHR